MYSATCVRHMQMVAQQPINIGFGTGATRRCTDRLATCETFLIMVSHLCASIDASFGFPLD